MSPLNQPISLQFALLVNRGDSIIVVGPFATDADAYAYRKRQEPSSTVIRFYAPI